MSMRMADAALSVILLLILWSFYRAQRDPAVSFNLLDLIMENGKVSRIAFAFLVCLMVTSWVLVKVAFDGKMTDLLFAAYGTMWVAPIIAKLFSPPSSTTSTSTTSTSTTSAPQPTPAPPKPKRVRKNG